MRYILDVSGRDLELIKASIVNFERSLELSSQGDFSHLIDELNDTYIIFMSNLYYLITKLQNEIATLEWQWFQKEISDKDYCLQFDDIKKRIEELQG
jgi:hypothetical protein